MRLEQTTAAGHHFDEPFVFTLSFDLIAGSEPALLSCNSCDTDYFLFLSNFVNAGRLK